MLIGWFMILLVSLLGLLSGSKRQLLKNALNTGFQNLTKANWDKIGQTFQKE